jgi:hypothetical protein
MPQLIRHPHAPSHSIQSVTAQAARTAEGKLSLSYSLSGDLARLRIPPPGPARIGWKLWRHTCCEVFIRARSGTSYHELNFSPSGEWTAYAFARYREGAPLDDETLDPQIAVEPGRDRLGLSALVDVGRLSAEYVHAPLALALAVIAEDENGALSYWALRHAPGQPDFHHAESFALELNEVRA